MGREWKPGDLGRCGSPSCGKGGLVVKADGFNEWWHPGYREAQKLPAELVVGPLVVIDPEDREQVDALCKALVEAMYAAGDKASAGNGVHPSTMAAALRTLANPQPPKPDEPLGLGAVVEDAEGEYWIRAARIKRGWHRPMGTWAAYDDVPAIKVLSEGVQS